MKRLTILLLAILPGTGCLSIEPIGPLADKTAATRPAPGVTVTTPDKPAVRPIVQSAPAPVPPALLVTPAEVTEANPEDAARRLMDELEADRRSMESMPRPAEISVVK